MRKLISNNHGNVGTIIMAVTVAIVLTISIIIVYSVMGGLDTTTIDKNLATKMGANTTTTKYAGNATGSLLTGLSTFFSLAPLYLVILAAVAIVGAVLGIMVVRRR